MMIVESKQYIVEKADEITNILLLQLTKECKQIKLEDEPAENIYLLLYIVSLFIVKIKLSIRDFCSTYSIESMTDEKITEIINEISSEISAQFEKYFKDAYAH